MQHKLGAAAEGESGSSVDEDNEEEMQEEEARSDGLHKTEKTPDFSFS